MTQYEEGWEIKLFWKFWLVVWRAGHLWLAGSASVDSGWGKGIENVVGNDAWSKIVLNE